MNLKFGLGLGVVALLLILGTVFAITPQQEQKTESVVAPGTCGISGGCGCGCSSTEGCTSCGCSLGQGCSVGGCSQGCNSCSGNLN